MRPVHVSDHALVRWLERKHGVDVEFFRRCILADVGDAVAAGASGMTLDGLLFCIRDGVVTTTTRPSRPRNQVYRKQLARERRRMGREAE